MSRWFMTNFARNSVMRLRISSDAPRHTCWARWLRLCASPSHPRYTLDDDGCGFVPRPLLHHTLKCWTMIAAALCLVLYSMTYQIHVQRGWLRLCASPFTPSHTKYMFSEVPVPRPLLQPFRCQFPNRTLQNIRRFSGDMLSR